MAFNKNIICAYAHIQVWLYMNLSHIKEKMEDRNEKVANI